MEKNTSNRMLTSSEMSNRLPGETDHQQARRARVAQHNKALRRLPSETLAQKRGAQ